MNNYKLQNTNIIILAIYFMMMAYLVSIHPSYGVMPFVLGAAIFFGLYLLMTLYFRITKKIPNTSIQRAIKINVYLNIGVLTLWILMMLTPLLAMTFLQPLLDKLISTDKAGLIFFFYSLIFLLIGNITTFIMFLRGMRSRLG